MYNLYIGFQKITTSKDPMDARIFDFSIIFIEFLVRFHQLVRTTNENARAKDATR